MTSPGPGGFQNRWLSSALLVWTLSNAQSPRPPLPRGLLKAPCILSPSLLLAVQQAAATSGPGP